MLIPPFPFAFPWICSHHHGPFLASFCWAKLSSGSSGLHFLGRPNSLSLYLFYFSWTWVVIKICRASGEVSWPWTGLLLLPYLWGNYLPSPATADSCFSQGQVVLVTYACPVTSQYLQALLIHPLSFSDDERPGHSSDAAPNPYSLWSGALHYWIPPHFYQLQSSSSSSSPPLDQKYPSYALLFSTFVVFIQPSKSLRKYKRLLKKDV